MMCKRGTGAKRRSVDRVAPWWAKEEEMAGGSRPMTTWWVKEGGRPSGNAGRPTMTRLRVGGTTARGEGGVSRGRVQADRWTTAQCGVTRHGGTQRLTCGPSHCAGGLNRVKQKFKRIQIQINSFKIVLIRTRPSRGQKN
jgi:hypothetical protein